jgi:hypothetical protein
MKSTNHEHAIELKTISGARFNTNYEGGDVDLVDGDGGDDGAYGDVDGYAFSQAKEEWGCRWCRFPLHWRYWCSRICPLPEKERTFTSAAISINLGKNMP